jgi:thiamine-phosphate pyrophosphorylase
MKPRHPLPTRWLMTDERQGDSLWRALARLPRGSGIVFRHHATPPRERRALYDRVRRIARARGLTLILAGPPSLAIAWGADGAHARPPHRRAARLLLHTAPAHDAREVIAARAADLLFVSPVFATRSHPGAPALGPRRHAALVRLARQPVAALGGMNASRARHIGARYWAAIDAWSQG